MLWSFSFSSGHRTSVSVKGMLVFNWLHLIITLFHQLSNTARTSPTWTARAAGRLAMNRLSCSPKSWKRKITATVYLSDMAVINRHARSSAIVQTAFIQRSVKAYHILQTTCSSTGWKRNPLVTQSFQKVRENTLQFSCACFSDPSSSTIVTADTLNIVFAGFKRFRSCVVRQPIRPADGLRPQHHESSFLLFTTPFGYDLN